MTKPDGVIKCEKMIKGYVASRRCLRPATDVDVDGTTHVCAWHRTDLAKVAARKAGTLGTCLKCGRFLSSLGTCAMCGK